MTDRRRGWRPFGSSARAAPAGLDRGLPSRAGSAVHTARGSGLAWTATRVLDRLVPWNCLGLWNPRTVSADALGEQVVAILRAWGMPDDPARATTELILYADLRGIDSHGAAMLPAYLAERRAGRLRADATVEVVREAETTALLDGGGGLGHVPARTAMELAIAKCRERGLGAVAVRNSGHFGAAGAYAAMAVQGGLVGVATSGTRAPAVVPTFAAEPMLGTNPIAFAAPAGVRAPFLLDMATSTVSLGKLVATWRSGSALPAGWALDRKGRPQRDGSAAARQRRLTPLGGSPEMGSHKGYGLGVLVDVLSSILPGSACRPGGGRDPGGIGHFFLAIDPGRFRPLEAFREDMDDMIEALHGSRAAQPDRPVLVAGDPERAVLEERCRGGIPLSRSVFEGVRAVAAASRVPFLIGDGR